MGEETSKECKGRERSGERNVLWEKYRKKVCKR
jgi:hypothetical protein